MNDDPRIEAIMQAIRTVESGGNYSAAGASGEFGAYQFMPDTWRKWARVHLNNEDAPLTPENQDAVAHAKIKEWVDDGFNPSDIFALWNSGTASWEGKIGKNAAGVMYNVPRYVVKGLTVLADILLHNSSGMTQHQTKMFYLFYFGRLPDTGELLFWSGKDPVALMHRAITDRAQLMAKEELK